MKKYIALLVFIIIGASIYAQPPMGDPGRGMGRPPSDKGTSKMQSQEIIIMEFPEIQGLTLKQREKLSSTVLAEKKKIHDLMMKQISLTMEAERGRTSKTFDQRKNDQKMKKVYEDIEKERLKADKKYRSILTPDQYNEFIAKKKDIKFKDYGFKRSDHPSYPLLKNDRKEPRADMHTDDTDV